MNLLGYFDVRHHIISSLTPSITNPLMNRSTPFWALVGLLTLFSTSLVAQSSQQGEWASFNKRYWNNQTDVNPDRQAALRKTEAWQNFKAAHGAWYVQFNEITGMPHRATGPAIPVSGSSAEDMAFNFLTNEMAEWNLPLANLALRSAHQTGKFHYVDFNQTYEGLTVLDTRVTVRLTLDNKVVLFGADVYPDMKANTTATISPAAAATSSASGIPLAVTEVEVSPELAILPIPGAAGMEFRLVYQVATHFESLNGIPGFFTSLVDARSGELLSRTSRVHDCAHPLVADVEVNGTVTDNPFAPTEERGLPYLRVNVGGTNYYTDVNGMLDIPSITTPTSATVHLEGQFASVRLGALGVTPASFVTTLNPGPNVISFDASANAREISAYYHTNIVHDFMKVFYPTFTALDFPFTVKVDRTDGTCNAFYDGSSINFYANGGGCPATALFSDVVYHEYGHGLNYDIYSFLGDPGGMNNGAMQEAYADVWGLSITGNPILGDGFSGVGSDVRRYDIDPKVYPDDLVGQVHADGEIIAGAWWDFGVLRGSLSEMTELFIAAYSATIDGADGSEGLIYREILLEALIQDDDDGDLSTGTPRDAEIISAFGMHGITLLANAELTHTPAIATADVPVEIEAQLLVDFPAYLGDVSMQWRLQGASSWNQVFLGEASDGIFTAELPAQPAGTILEYYFEVEDIYDVKALTKPAKADQPSDPNLPFFTLVGFTLQEQEDFDLFAGDWVFDPNGTDNATTGLWEINIPQTSSTSGFVNQPGFDHSPDNTLNFCLVTGYQGYTSSSPANFDVDGGETTVHSPLFDATAYDDPVFSYYRWFSNDPPGGANPGNDPFEVYISNDESTWVPVRNTFTSDASWRQDVIRISDYVGATNTVGLRFVVSDRFIAGAPLDGGSLVEALIDDLYLYGIGEGPVDTTTTSGLNDPFSGLAIELYPNPTSGAFQIGLPANFQADYLELLNSAGQLVWSKTGLSVSNPIAVPDLGLAEGLYTIRVKAGESWLNRRIILQQ